NRQGVFGVQRVTDSQPLGLTPAPDDTERHNWVRNALTEQRRHLRRKQDAESATHNRVPRSVRIVGETESRPQIDPSIVVDRLVEGTRRPEVKLAKVCGRRQVLDADRHLSGRLNNIIGVEVVPKPSIENQLGTHPKVVLTKESELKHSRLVRPVRAERNINRAGNIGSHVRFVVERVRWVLGVGTAAVIPNEATAELEQVFPQVSPDLLVEAEGLPLHIPDFGAAPCADVRYSESRHPALPFDLLRLVRVFEGEELIKPQHIRSVDAEAGF